MNNDKNEMTREEAEEDFKKKAADIFSKQIPGVYRDEDGFIVIPRKVRKKPTSSEE